jgi:hypothetical protein
MTLMDKFGRYVPFEIAEDYLNGGLLDNFSTSVYLNGKKNIEMSNNIKIFDKIQEQKDNSIFNLLDKNKSKF